MGIFRNKPNAGNEGAGNEPEPRDADGRPIPGRGAEGGEMTGSDPDQTEELIEAIKRDLEAVAKERDEAIEKWKRAVADHQNSQKRALANEQEARRQGVTGVLHSVLPVLDHFDVALSATAAKGTTEQIMQGVSAIRAELLKALETHGVRLIAPAPDDVFDPNQHQAISMLEAGATGVQPGNVLALFQPGYALGDRVIRPAKVSVAASPPSE